MRSMNVRRVTYEIKWNTFCPLPASFSIILDVHYSFSQPRIYHKSLCHE